MRVGIIKKHIKFSALKGFVADATYTERYMGAASQLAYEKANLVRNVSMFKRVKFLLVHGTADGLFF